MRKNTKTKPEMSRLTLKFARKGSKTTSCPQKTGPVHCYLEGRVLEWCRLVPCTTSGHTVRSKSCTVQSDLGPVWIRSRLVLRSIWSRFRVQTEVLVFGLAPFEMDQIAFVYFRFSGTRTAHTNLISSSRGTSRR